MNALQQIAFDLLVQKLAEQQTDVAQMQAIVKNCSGVNTMDRLPAPEERKKYEEALRNYKKVTNEINGITRALNENI